MVQNESMTEFPVCLVHTCTDYKVWKRLGGKNHGFNYIIMLSLGLFTFSGFGNLI